MEAFEALLLISFIIGIQVFFEIWKASTEG
jgi:hypothetical protein